MFVWPADTKDILVMLSDMDINAIAGTLKLYFRELPEPLLTDRLYRAFMEGIGLCHCFNNSTSAKCGLSVNTINMFRVSLTALSDPAAKENCMMHLLRSLPEPNLMTFLTLLEHLKRYLICFIIRSCIVFIVLVDLDIIYTYIVLQSG